MKNFFKRLIIGFLPIFLVKKRVFFVFCIFILRGGLLGQEIELPVDTLAGIDKVFRTSDLDDEVPTSWQRRRTKSSSSQIGVAEAAAGLRREQRIGCICMSGEQRSSTGTGSCNGRGGVRFWVYLNDAGETVQIATWRHLQDTEGGATKLAQGFAPNSGADNRQVVEIRIDTSGHTPQVVYIQPNSVQPQVQVVPSQHTLGDKVLSMVVVGISAALLSALIDRYLKKKDTDDKEKKEEEQRNMTPQNNNDDLPF